MVQMFGGELMSVKSLLCLSSIVLSFTAAPAFAQQQERAVSSSFSGASVSATRSGPSRGEALSEPGAPWVGMESVRVADLEAAGVRIEADAAQPDPLSPELAAMMAADGAESINGWDSRMRMRTALYPNRAIVYISYNGQHFCTGFMVSANVMATAGHCVHSGGADGSWYDQTLMQVFPGRDGASSPFGSCGVVQMHSVWGWTNNHYSEYDYGAMTLDCTIGNTVGWFGIYHLAGTTAFAGEPAIVSGYPGDKPQEQWLSADIVRRSEWARVCYRMDTIGGHSGSPVFHDRGWANYATGTWAFAIHTYGYSPSICGGNRNAGTRLTRGRINNFSNWINAAAN